MLDILVAIIEELTGTKKKAPPPRRHVRPPPPPPPQATGPVAQGTSPEFDKMVKQFFGIPDDEEEDEAEVEAEKIAPPPPPVRKPEPRPVRPAPALLAKTAVEPIPEPMSAFIDEPVYLDNAVPMATPPRSGKSTYGRDLAAKLRGNPKVARDAFIYSEIFGPPLADR